MQGPESGHCGGNRPALEGAASRLGRRRRAALEGSRPALEEAESKLGGAGRGAGSLGGLASSSLGEGGPISAFAVTGVKWTFQRLLQT